MKDDSDRLLRLLAAFTCFAIIAARMLVPTLKFDNTSLGLLALGVLIILIPDIGDLVSRIRKLRKGDFELEFGSRIDALEKNTREAEDILETEDLQYGGIPDPVQERIQKSLIEPRAALITVAVEIEGRLQELAESYSVKGRGRFFSPRNTINALSERKILDSHLPSLFADFWAIRNQAVHANELSLGDNRIFQIVDLGLRILKLLYAVRAPGENKSADFGT